MLDWLSALAPSVWHWILSYPWNWVENHPWLSATVAFFIAFGKKVWARLEPKAVDFVAESLQHRVAILITGYGKLYAKHLYYRHRTFDVKGFSTQGKFALELENVYVDLDVDPAAVRTISQDPIRLPKDVQKSGNRSIFVWLKADPDHPRNFAIIGPPGSGKTTLLKHLALLLSNRQAPVRRTPVLLFLRDHGAAIGANADIKLTELIEASLKALPPPPLWFQDRLDKGKCLIMLDGLDEVADPELRSKVVRWVERQVEFLGANRFLVSSRPSGYRDNPLSGFTALQVLPFNRDQVERFVRNWYFANEVVAHQKNDPGVSMEADKGAADLLDRFRRASTLQDLAVNPLLLTLIATVHRYRSQLPGRRVELFAEICDVFLGKRQQAKGLELDLTPAQKVRVLRVLAYGMMSREVREIRTPEAAELIAPVLKVVMPNGEPAAFLSMIEDSSALLVQKESGLYGFAHLTFQEYLASLHVKEEKLVAELAGRIGETWWHETARLYSAQADATPIVEKCVAPERPTVNALLLAADCEEEALELREDLREKIRRITEGAVEDPEPDRRQLAAEHMLARRFRNMIRVTDDRYVDASPVTHAEYQLFINEMLAKGRHRQPDHWETYQFPPGSGSKPIVGMRRSDVEKFCEWLGARRSGEWTWDLPTTEDLKGLRGQNDAWESLIFFAKGDADEKPLPIPGQRILAQILKDLDFISAPGLRPEFSRASRRIAWFSVWLNALGALTRDRDLALDRYLALPLPDRALALSDRVPDLDLPQLALDRARNLAPELDHILERVLDPVRERARALTLIRDPDPTSPSPAATPNPTLPARPPDLALRDLALALPDLALPLDGYLALDLVSDPDRALTLASELDRLVDRDRDRDRDLHSDTAHDLARDLDRDLARDSARDSARDLIAARALVRNLTRHPDLFASVFHRALRVVCDLVRGRPFSRTLSSSSTVRDLVLGRAIRTSSAARAIARSLSAFMLNWLCAVEGRAKGELPVTEGLWISRVFRDAEKVEVTAALVKPMKPSTKFFDVTSG